MDEWVRREVEGGGEEEKRILYKRCGNIRRKLMLDRPDKYIDYESCFGRNHTRATPSTGSMI